VPAASRITDTSLSELVLALPSAIAYVYQKVRFDALI
jgi:hypothetical protein